MTAPPTPHKPAAPEPRRPGQLDLDRLGILQWFRVGEYERVEAAIADLASLGVQRMRTGISWADFYSAAGAKWYDWMIPTISRHVELLPCFTYTPPSLGVAAKTSSPPREPKAFADFLDVMITRYDRHFEYMELWNEPNNTSEWDWTLDCEWKTFCEMIGKAAYWVQHRGKKTVLAGMSPIDPNWLALMFKRGVMEYIDIVGVHGFPGTFDAHWEGWPANLERVRDVLDRHRHDGAIWITECGYSTWRHEPRKQLRELMRAIRSGAERIYWYSLYDLQKDHPTVDGPRSDQREYHFGIKDADGRSKTLFRLWKSSNGLGLTPLRWMARPARLGSTRRRTALITGGAGFIGTNLADQLATDGYDVILYDNLSRPGTEINAQWLRRTHGRRVQLELADIRDTVALRRAVRSACEVYHLAAQVAVTTSLTDPLGDFAINAAGTVGLLDEVRSCPTPPTLLMTSTNKVYGSLADLKLRPAATRYEPADPEILASGVGECPPLDFHSPYGCSKGCADQYVLDFSRSYRLPMAVFRMSCIYGPHQHGNEDQGWVAHFLISAIEGRALTLYGDGRQVRDILYVEDLVRAMRLAQGNMPRLAGRAFNIGGGPANCISLVELLSMIADIHGHAPRYSFDQWRTGDQRYFVADTRRFRTATGWEPQTGAAQGVRRLLQWLLVSRGLAETPLAPATSTKGAVT
jgi:CDP-paratose 2-epimerase